MKSTLQHRVLLPGALLVLLSGLAVAAIPARPPLSPARGQELGATYEAYLTPHQEPGEESETPAATPEVFRSTAPSLTRDQREAQGHRGHGVVRFTRDLSRAYVDVQIEGIDPADINMFHIHCGRPGVLGPILVDFSLGTDIQKEFADGVFTFEVRNEHITQTAAHGHGLVAAFTSGCMIRSPSLESIKPARISTVAGMAYIAAEGDLYFNLHTRGQTFYGDIRGQWLPTAP